SPRLTRVTAQDTAPETGGSAPGRLSSPTLAEHPPFPTAEMPRRSSPPGWSPLPMIQARRPTLVVVGTGMAGARVVEEVLARAPGRFDIRMFGAEPHGTYNRILLSGVLGGFTDPDRLWLNPLEWYESRGVFVHAGVKVETIDRASRLVSGGGGKVVEPYDILILATGS